MLIDKIVGAQSSHLIGQNYCNHFEDHIRLATIEKIAGECFPRELYRDAVCGFADPK